MSVGIFTWMLQNFPKNRAILVQKLCGEKKLSKSVFSYFKTKKKKKFRWPLSLRGGGKALVAWPLVDELFFAASLREDTYKKFKYLNICMFLRSFVCISWVSQYCRLRPHVRWSSLFRFYWDHVNWRKTRNTRKLLFQLSLNSG